MEIRYPLILIISIIIFFIIIFIKNKKSQHNPNSIANTSFIKEIDYYKELLKKYQKYLISIFGILFLMLLSSSLLSSRIATIDTIKNEIHDRDIMLCLDVSGSMYSLDDKIIQAYSQIVKGMDGERFGVTIFDSSSYVLIPLTTDYDYIEEILKQLSDSINENQKTTGKIDYDLSSYIYDGTTEGNGSSVIGDGFATCVLSYPKLTEDRSRILILATDNSVSGPQIVTVAEATKLAQKYKISVYPLSPYDDNYEETNELRDVAKKTNGTFYGLNDVNNTQKIIKSIESKEKTARKSNPVTIGTDHPTIPFIILLISFGSFLIISRMVKI